MDVTQEPTDWLPGLGSYSTSIGPIVVSVTVLEISDIKAIFR